ncbi:MAG: Asp-tRNA(Asn)/Glu-tRNA(Gln) amidotransferase subunit GatA [Chloroflexia bacterium]|nr:Asp-tRNA(Asn)/Glu-tRNA(Gln) amidotransferase subunit GatA [Chloroflexia bacterium]
MTALTAAEARRALDARELSAIELTRSYLARIDRLDDEIGAYLHVMRDVALSQAETADRRIAAGNSEPMTGIPVALKDVLCTIDAPTTAASRILEGFRPPYDATVVNRLRRQGAVFLGKANTDEFAMGSSNENSAFKPVRNPWHRDRVPGGSSGGPAAAVAAEMAMVSLGSDTGGSIRQPAGFCGVVGLKPTYGRVSRFGLLAFASSLDQIGPFARTVRDAAMVLQAIAGHDPFDATSSPEPSPDYSRALSGDIRGMKIGLAREYTADGMEDGVFAAFNSAIHRFRALGAEIVSIDLPHTEYALPTYYITAPAEASANLARYDGVKYGSVETASTLRETYARTRGKGFGPEVKRRIMLGTYALSSGYYDAYYIKAQKVRTLIKQDFDAAWSKVDAIVAPTSPTVAFPLGARTDDPYQMYLADVFTIPANMAGIPGVAVPCGFSEELPVSLQVLGPAFAEATILRIADAYERTESWAARRPQIAAAG